MYICNITKYELSVKLSAVNAYSRYRFSHIAVTLNSLIICVLRTIFVKYVTYMRKHTLHTADKKYLVKSITQFWHYL